MGLKIIGTVGCQFSICLDENVAVLNRETGLFDQINKRLFTGPLVKLYPVFAPNSQIIRYYTAEVKLDDPNSTRPEYFNLKTGKPVTYFDAIMSLTRSAQHMLAEGQIAIAVTPDTVDAVRQALNEGFPANRINDSLGLLNDKKEPEITNEDPIMAQPEISAVEATFSEADVKGIEDLAKLPSKKKNAKS